MNIIHEEKKMMYGAFMFMHRDLQGVWGEVVGQISQTAVADIQELPGGSGHGCPAPERPHGAAAGRLPWPAFTVPGDPSAGCGSRTTWIWDDPWAHLPQRWAEYKQDIYLVDPRQEVQVKCLRK